MAMNKKMNLKKEINFNFIEFKDYIKSLPFEKRKIFYDNAPKLNLENEEEKDMFLILSVLELNEDIK